MVTLTGFVTSAAPGGAGRRLELRHLAGVERRVGGAESGPKQADELAGQSRCRTGNLARVADLFGSPAV